MDALAHALAQKARAASAHVAKAPDWNQIASFYAGRPVTVTSPAINPITNQPWGGIDGTTPRNGTIYLNPRLQQGLNELPRDLPKGMGTVYALANLIHEALHNRANKSDGFADWGDEIQAPALAAQLIPDALQRYFGIPIQSKLGQRYQQIAQSLAHGLNTGQTQSLAPTSMPGWNGNIFQR